MRRRLAPHCGLVFLAIGTALVSLVALAPRAMGTDWLEDRTSRAVVLSRPGGELGRDLVIARVDAERDGLAKAIGLEADEEEIRVWLYPDADSLRVDRPLVVLAGAELAFPHRSRRDVLLLAPPERPPEDLLWGLRHGLAHRALVARSEARLPEGFQEGLAAYLAGLRSSEVVGIARLRDGRGRGALLPWSDLASPGAAYLDPALSYPQARSVAQFLVDTHGLAALGRWLDASTVAGGWRQAMGMAFGQDAGRLEAEWSVWLPNYLDGGWRNHALYSVDLGSAEVRLAQGDPAGAVALLDGRGALDPQGQERAAYLRRVAEASMAAMAYVADAQVALAAGDHARAAAAAAEAGRLSGEADDAATAVVAAELLRRANMGLASQILLRRAEALPAWRSLEARAAARQALADLRALGQDAAADEARRVLADLDRRLLPAGYGLLAAGAGLLSWNLHRRRRDARAECPP